MRIYLDACALNRLTDDQSQSRIQNEAEAVESVFHLIWTGKAGRNLGKAMVRVLNPVDGLQELRR